MEERTKVSAPFSGPFSKGTACEHSCENRNKTRQQDKATVPTGNAGLKQSGRKLGWVLGVCGHDGSVAVSKPQPALRHQLPKHPELLRRTAA